MSDTKTHYLGKINELNVEIYPELKAVLDDILCFRNLYDYDELEENILQFVSEFNSLSTLERKLVFPAINSLFASQEAQKEGEEEAKPFIPNIQEIISLTQRKDEKLRKMVIIIEEILQTQNIHTPNNFEKNVLHFIQLCNHVYFPAKNSWIELLKYIAQNTPAKSIESV